MAQITPVDHVAALEAAVAFLYAYVANLLARDGLAPTAAGVASEITSEAVAWARLDGGSSEALEVLFAQVAGLTELLERSRNR